MQEIASALNTAKYDDTNLVLFSGLGNVFCSGIDLHYLMVGDKKVAARKMVDALRFVKINSNLSFYHTARWEVFKKHIYI